MAKKYSCKNCGAELYFEPKSGHLHCDYCGSEYDPSEYDFTPEDEAAADQTIAQAGNEASAVPEAARTDEAATDDSVSSDDLVVYQCPNCGAEVITSEKTVATTCVYCNRAITLAGNIKGNFKPDFVLPFTQERADVEKAYKALCRKSPLTPRLFTKEANIKKIKGMYIPYWLFTFEGSASINMHGERVRSFMTGDDEITEISRYEILEEGRGSFSKVPADALKAMDNIMMDSIEPFDLGKLKAFNPAYLTGFYTQRWDDPSSATEPRAKARAKEALSLAVTKHAGSYTTSVIENESYSWTGHKEEYAMLPVWMMYTEYKGKNYIFGMNGQTGKMMGELPKDNLVLVRYALIVFIAVQLIMMIIRVVGVML